MNFKQLEEACENCQKCPLGQLRNKVVLERGNRQAKLMFVGEAPGGREDETGIPFVGPAGQLFDRYLAAVGIDREEVYVCNILKCRPPKTGTPCLQSRRPVWNICAHKCGWSSRKSLSVLDESPLCA